ncbi:hypothetical protein Pmani_019245 [Petrolisthes manimaculis]|uniref:Uncharacterized protein n=1 Tax=Petrolisthes manimaculis TaxID=1843537 RepID=A0AAE1PKU1_9EUCA|nr:hypothetical protein Pmani_019245 [Petrolisthes manimaculis]
MVWGGSGGVEGIGGRLRALVTSLTHHASSRFNPTQHSNNNITSPSPPTDLTPTHPRPRRHQGEGKGRGERRAKEGERRSRRGKRERDRGKCGGGDELGLHQYLPPNPHTVGIPVLAPTHHTPNSSHPQANTPLRASLPALSTNYTPAHTPASPSSLTPASPSSLTYGFLVAGPSSPIRSGTLVTGPPSLLPATRRNSCTSGRPITEVPTTSPSLLTRARDTLSPSLARVRDTISPTLARLRGRTTTTTNTTTSPRPSPRRIHSHDRHRKRSEGSVGARVVVGPSPPVWQAHTTPPEVYVVEMSENPRQARTPAPASHRTLASSQPPNPPQGQQRWQLCPNSCRSCLPDAQEVVFILGRAQVNSSLYSLYVVHTPHPQYNHHICMCLLAAGVPQHIYTLPVYNSVFVDILTWFRSSPGITVYIM